MAEQLHATYRTLYLPPGPEVKVPYAFLGSPYGDEERAAVSRVIDSGWLTTATETVAFEQEFGRLHEVEYAYACSNCTTALHMAAQLCRFEEGDEVITTPVTFISTNQAILVTGALPVFVDVDRRTFNIDPERVAEAVTERTKAIFLTHMTGQMCDMDAIMEIADEHGLIVVEDCAHVQGARYKGRPAGSIGDAGCFSFHAIKNITTLGEGGMLVTKRRDFAIDIPWLRSMGSRYPGDCFDDGTPGPRPYDVDLVAGVVPNNVRMTEAQAAVGRAQLLKLDAILARRRWIAATWADAAAPIEGVEPPHVIEGVEHTYHNFALLVDPARAGFTNHELSQRLLGDHGVQTFPGLYRPSYLFGIYKQRAYGGGDCPNAEWVSSNALQLPLNPNLSDEQVMLVADALGKAAADLG